MRTRGSTALSLSRNLGRAVFLLASFLAAPSGAADCGDHVGGSRVACACGDTVVSSTTLRFSDPIVATRCPGDGLIVRANESIDTLILDLAGLAIVGTGTGVGIDIERGGNDGAAIVGGRARRRGEVVAFNVGLRVRRPSAVRRIEALELEGNRHEGMQLRTAGTMVVDVLATRNGGDGFLVTGRGGRLIDIEARENGDAGIRAYAYDLVIGAHAVANARHGIVIGGYRNDLGVSIASANRGSGVLLSGSRHTTDRVVASDNSEGGIVHRKPGGER